MVQQKVFAAQVFEEVCRLAFGSARGEAAAGELCESQVVAFDAAV